MNPVRGIETGGLHIPERVRPAFQINESRSRDWNNTVAYAEQQTSGSFKLMNPVRGIETILKTRISYPGFYFQINESRSRDWNAHLGMQAKSCC